jgi:hypothetical protein
MALDRGGGRGTGSLPTLLAPTSGRSFTELEASDVEAKTAPEQIDWRCDFRLLLTSFGTIIGTIYQPAPQQEKTPPTVMAGGVVI